MEILLIEGTEDTPKIIFDKQKEIFEISGRSLIENSLEFYKPVLKWIMAYSQNPNPTTICSFKLEYINTDSAKRILDVLSAFDKIKETKIIWYFHEDDEDMEETGEEFSELVEIPFELVTY
ncbi:MAG: DUF1987 domain-containing protein [Bacteroidia bacterium]|nr:DUF1987 domain-containing protein [Bacteroidia bacterium]